MWVWKCEGCGREINPHDEVNLGGKCDGEEAFFGMHVYAQIEVAIPDTIESVLKAG